MFLNNKLNKDNFVKKNHSCTWKILKIVILRTKKVTRYCIIKERGNISPNLLNMLCWLSIYENTFYILKKNHYCFLKGFEKIL